MTTQTTLQSYEFKYRLSYLTVFRWSRQLQVRRDTLDPVDKIDLPPLHEASDGFLLRSVPESVVAGEPGMIRYVMQRFPRYYIDMSTDFEAYKSKFSGKTRSTIQRKVKKFAEHCGGTLRWSTYRTPEEIREFWKLARSISVKTYQEKLLDAGLPDGPQYLLRAESWAADDALRAYLLFDGETPVSYLFCPIQDGVINYAYLGYDPNYQKLSAGTVLQWLALEELFNEQRYRYFDFTEGESEHKRLFGTGKLECAHVALLRPTFANRVLARTHAGFNRAVEGFGRWLERNQLKAKVQRWMRRKG